MVRGRRLRPRVGSSPLLAASLVCAVLLSASAAPVSSAQGGCARELDAVIWGGAQWMPFGQAVAAKPSPCVEYFITVLPQDVDKTMLRFRTVFDPLRALD